MNSAAIIETLNPYIEQFDDSLNAILVKDLRQIVRGKIFWLAFFVFLSAIVLVLYSSLGNSRNYGDIDGNYISMAMLGILYLTCGVIIPVSIGLKTSRELNDANHELLFITTMSPASIVNGKFLSGAIIILMTFSTIAPFLSLTLLIGGVDLINLFLAIIYTFMMSNLFLFGELFMGIASGKKSQAGGFFDKIGTGIAHFVLWIWSCSLGVGIIESRMFGSYSDWQIFCYGFWIIFGVIILGTLVYLLVVSNLQPDSSNKMYSFKRMTSVVWLIAIVLSCFDSNFNEISCVVIMIFLCIVSVFFHAEPDTYSNRVISEIPDAFTQRVLKFPFFYGRINAFTWISLTGISTFIIGMFCYYALNDSAFKSDFPDFLIFLAEFLVYINAYCFFSDFIRKLVFPNASRQYNIGIFAFLFLGSTIILWFGESFGKLGDFIALINPFGAMYLRNHSERILLAVGFILLILSMCTSLSSILKQINTYFKKITIPNKYNYKPIYRKQNTINN